MSTISLVQDRYQGYHVGTGVTWQAGMLNVLATGLMSDADASNPALTLKFGMEFSFDGGVTFDSPVSLDAWAGGTNPRTNGPNLPAVGSGFEASGSTPTHVRVFIDAPLPISIGGKVEFSA